VGMPARFSGTPGTIRLGPPTVGQHTDELLAGLGYPATEIQRLRREGCV
jgi:crotonobetainyl-CoA:carnitine CoA-transferase CaiB-like acyl-CoA transferase